MVKQSSLKGQNIPQLICDSNGHGLVHFCNWTSFLSQFFKQVPNITSFLNFKAAHGFYGEIRLKEYSDSSEQWLPILKTGICLIDLDTMPTEKTIPDLDLKRQWYLFEQIRPHCKTNLSKDLTCPQPSAPKNSVIPHNSDDEVGDNQPCKKKETNSNMWCL